MKKFSIVILAAVIIMAVFFCLQPKWYLKNSKWPIDDSITMRLTRLGDTALNTNDVPVAAILVYNNEVLGEGFNTVLRNKLAGGHAEINAISDAMGRTGVDSFMHLDRERLTLVTTWEPCLMCKGAIVEYNIKHVVVVKAKPFVSLLKEWKKSVKYEWNKQAATTDTLQLYLFKKHPLFKEQKVDGR